MLWSWNCTIRPFSGTSSATRRPKRWYCWCSSSGLPCCSTSTAAALRSSTDEAGRCLGVSADRAGGGGDAAALLLDDHHGREPSAGYHRLPAQVDPQSPDPGPFPRGRSKGAVATVLQEQSGCGDRISGVVRVVRSLRGLRVCRLQVPAAEFLLSVDPGDADGAGPGHQCLPVRVPGQVQLVRYL